MKHPVRKEIAIADVKTNRPISTEAYEYYMQGRYFHNKKYFYSDNMEDFFTSERMFKQAIKESLLNVNPTLDATLPKIEVVVRHRLLEPIDLEIIFQNAGKWNNYYQFLHHTGLRAGDVAMLKYGNKNFSAILF